MVDSEIQQPTDTINPETISGLFGVPERKVSAIKETVKESYAAHKGDIKATVADIKILFGDHDNRNEMAYAMLLIGKLHGMTESKREQDGMLNAALNAGAKTSIEIVAEALRRWEPEGFKAFVRVNERLADIAKNERENQKRRDHSLDFDE
jgi:hypothetical protein